MSFNDSMNISAAYPSKPCAVLRITGEDHEAFLNNQGTAALPGPVGSCRYTLWLDYMGRIHADSFVLSLDADQKLLVSYESDAALLIEKFSKHIIVDDVEMSNETKQWRLLSFRTGKLEQAPASGEFIRQGNGFLFSGRRLGTQSVDWLLPLEDYPSKIVDPITEKEAETLRLEAGVPLVPQDSGEGILNPVECAVLSAVSFDKGCYLGQEVVARVHRLQRHPRRLVRVTGEGRMPAVPYYLLVDGQPVGELTSVVQTGESFTALGWLKSRTKDGDITLNGRRFSVETLSPS